MADISIALIKELREKTGAGMMDCKKALVESNGNVEKAIAWLREKGIANAEKKSGRIAAEGIVESYIHGNGRVGVLVEVNVETDFASNNQDFKAFVKDVAMQIAAMNPKWIRREEVPQDALAKESEIVRNQALNEGKPEKIVDKIVEGRMSKFYSEHCLLEQPFVKDDSKTMQQLLTDNIVRIGENISIRRFARFEMGEGIEKKEDNFAEEVLAATK